MLSSILTGWSLMRGLRLFLAVIISIQAIQAHDWMLGFIAFIFLFQAVTNTGCCGAQGCTLPATEKKSAKTEEIEFEEL